MNYILIKKLSDLLALIDAPLFLLGQKSLIDEETYQNMWAISFSDKLIQKLTAEDLATFISQLLEKRTLQVSAMNQMTPVTFYLWFDKQALQLRFNIISGDIVALPFTCKFNLISSFQPILQDVIATGRIVATKGDLIQFIDFDDVDDASEAEYVLDVYRRVLHPSEQL